MINKPVEGNESETRLYPFELVYSLCFVEYICTTSQGEYIYDEQSLDRLNIILLLS